MAQRQIEEAEYQRLLGKEQVANLAEALYNHPKTGRQTRALIKEFNPEIQIPDYEIRQEFEARLDQEKQEREEAERKRVEEEQDRKYKDQRAQVQKDYGFTEEGMKELEDFMVKENVGSYEVAAGYKASKQPKQSDADQDTGREHYWNHSKQEGFAEIAADPEKWGHTTLVKALRADEAQQKGWR